MPVRECSGTHENFIESEFVLRLAENMENHDEFLICHMT